MLFKETPHFTRAATRLLSYDEFLEMQDVLLVAPDKGDVIPGGGGIRKLRVAAKGHGKRGGARIIYFWIVSDDEILLLDIFPKNFKPDLTRDEMKRLRRIVESEYP